MLLRIFLGFDQSVAVDNVKLNVHPFLIEVVTYQAAEVAQTVLASQTRRQEFLIIERTVGGDKVIQLGN